MRNFPLFALGAIIVASMPLHADDDKPNTTLPAANAVNAIGIDLLAKTKPGENALLSPWSIGSALAMTYAGASGKTRDEMAAALHFPKDATNLDASFADLRKNLENEQDVVARYLSPDDPAAAAKNPPPPALLLSVANRLYGQTDYAFRDKFLALLKDKYDAPFQAIDFIKSPGDATKTINSWVGDRTHDRIKDLIPPNAVTKATRLVLVNAIYFKAAWDSYFDKSETKPSAFHIKGGAPADVPMMHRHTYAAYVKREGYTIVTLFYIGKNLQFLVLLPDDPKGLPALEAKLTPSLLAGCGDALDHDFHLVDIWLPKFKLEPPAMELSDALKKMGMKTAFDDPKGSADFDATAPRKKGDYLFISAIYHKTFLSLDEDGTEAAGATAVLEMAGSAGPPPEEPKEIHVDHPFLFAIQDCYSGACLFLGRVTDPR